MVKHIPPMVAVVVAFFAAVSSPSRAALLDTAGLDLLQGQFLDFIDVTNIYTRQVGINDNSGAWHAAVDGRGSTFTLMLITGATADQDGNDNDGYGTFSGPMIIGGYNPQSWNSTGSFNMTSALADRTAFLFNLTLSTFMNQDFAGTGDYQTLNAGNLGPTFGLGLDLYVNGSLNGGTVFPGSYIDTGRTVANILDTANAWSFTLGEMETYAVSAVPLPPSAILFGTALLGLGGLKRRRRKKAAL